MTKAELVAQVAEKANLKKKDAKIAVEAVLSSMEEALVAGEKVQLIGFGSFEVRKRPARNAKNPRTGEEIKVPASKAPSFKAGKALKDAVNKKSGKAKK